MIITPSQFFMLLIKAYKLMKERNVKRTNRGDQIVSFGSILQAV